MALNHCVLLASRRVVPGRTLPMIKTAKTGHSPDIQILSPYSAWSHSGVAGWDARLEESNVVLAPERRVTRQTARKSAAGIGFAARVC
jgi:hypothetical protein